MKNKIVYLGIILTVILSGCGKKTADKDNHLSYDNSENIEADGGSEVHNDNQNVFLKEEADEWNVLEENTKETIYSLDDRLQNVLQVYQNEGKTKVLAVNEENSIFLYNITDDKLYSYQLDKNKNKHKIAKKPQRDICRILQVFHQHRTVDHPVFVSRQAIPAPNILLSLS